MAVPTRPLSEINRQAIHLLATEMGVADAVRFLSQFSTGQGNYTEERRQLFEGLTLDEITEQIKSERGTGNQ